MSSWAILPAYLVRVAGFAFARLEPLHCPRSMRAADELAAAESECTRLGRELDEVIAHQRFADHPAFDDRDARHAFSRRVKHARAFARKPALGATPPSDDLAAIASMFDAVRAHGDAFVRAHARWRAAEAAYREMFADELERARASLRTLYRDERLQEAVFIESPEAFERIQQLVAADGPRNARARQRERLGALYAQRFCAKNDTNSICGPHGVGYFAAGPSRPARIDIAPTDGRRATYFSYWAAQQILEHAALRAGDDVATYRRVPSARLDGDSARWCVMEHDATTTFKRRYARSELSSDGVRLLEALARPHTLAELAPTAGELGLDREELAAFLDELVRAGLVLRGPLLPPGSFHPLRAVAKELERWPASDGRSWALAELGAFEELVRTFANAPLPGRVEAFRAIGARFAQLTGSAAYRGEGQHYADRSVLHEDCYVDVAPELGGLRSTLEAALPVIMPVLELPLELARERTREWFRARFGEGARVAALDVHRAFDEERVLETAATTARSTELRRALQRVRDAIASAVAGARDGVAELSGHELRGALAELAAPARAGYLSLDVMLAGDQLVLGEVHGFLWLPTCLLDVLPPEHRERVVEQMAAAVRELGGGRPTAECVFLHTQATDRRIPLASADLQMLVPVDRPHAIDLGALDMRLAGDELEVLHADQEIVPLIAYVSYPFFMYASRVAPLIDDCADRFFPDSLLPDAVRDGDAPRLIVDGVVVRRRTWQRPVHAVRALLAGSSEAELFRGAQALRRELGCGRHVFVSLRGEPKPILLDFGDAFLVEALANLLERQRDDGVVKVSEMLPGPDELVAHGADGARTCEIRLGVYRRATDGG